MSILIGDVQKFKLRFFAKVICAIAISLGASLAWAASAIPITVRAAVLLDPGSAGTSISLSEVIDPMTIPMAQREEILRHLKEIVLTDRPALGEERVFTQEGLETIIVEANSRLGAAGLAVEWRLPRRTQVTVRTGLSRDAIARQIKDETIKRCGECDVEVRNLDSAVFSNRDVVDWRLLIGSDRPRGSFAVPLELTLKGGAKSSSMVTGQIVIFQKVLTAARVLQAGQRLAAGDVREERRNLTYATDAPASVADFNNSVLARGLNLGETIWRGALRREQVVRYGDPVKIQIGGDTWSITTEGIAQAAAAIGDSLRVKISHSQKLVSGVLKEKGLVEIQ